MREQMMREQLTRKDRGFTLIELLIVVVIIGILAAIAIPRFQDARERAFISSMKSDLRNMQSAQELYFADNFDYAADLGTLGFTQSAGVTVAISTPSATGWAALATHTGTAETCAVFIGSGTPVGPSTAQDAGKVVCDGDVPAAPPTP